MVSGRRGNGTDGGINMRGQLDVRSCGKQRSSDSRDEDNGTRVNTEVDAGKSEADRGMNKGVVWFQAGAAMELMVSTCRANWM